MALWTGKVNSTTTNMPNVTGRAPEREPTRIVLQIGGPGGPLYAARFKDRLVLGCGAADWDIDIDLRPYDGPQQGVSKHHAAIRSDGESLWVEDLSSVFGTRINGAILAPGKVVRLRSGDELMLGTLPISIRVLRA